MPLSKEKTSNPPTQYDSFIIISSHATLFKDALMEKKKNQKTKQTNKQTNK